MSEHPSIQKLSGYVWAAIVVTFGCTLILMSLNSHRPTEGDSAVAADQAEPTQRSHLAVGSRPSGPMEASVAPE